MAADAWTEEDRLYRGDSRHGPETPVPDADRSFVRHILYIGGAGRESPYLSTTESEAIARTKYAGPKGMVRFTYVPHARELRVDHIGYLELMDLLQGRGKGRAQSRNAMQVAQARRYVEESLEHLLDFRRHGAADSAAPSNLDEVVRQVFDPLRGYPT